MGNAGITVAQYGGLCIPCHTGRQHGAAGAGYHEGRLELVTQPHERTFEVNGVSVDFDLSRYDFTRSTEDNHAVAHFTGVHRDIRPLLDYTYHRKYSAERVEVQDRLIESMCAGKERHSAMFPWVVYTAGAMGAGKGHVASWMHDNGYWHKDYFVKVDPDEIRQTLPEWPGYVKRCPERAGDLTQKEAGCIAEILTYKALRERKNVIIDGSLSDQKWYQSQFLKFRENFPGIRIMVLHVVADTEDILKQAEERGKGPSGRVVPRSKLLESIKLVPASVKALSPYADFVCRVVNKKGKTPQIEREEGAPYPSASAQLTWDLIKLLWSDIDADGDGSLSKEEIEAALCLGTLTKVSLASMDENGDMKISKTEIDRASLRARTAATKQYR